MYSEFAALVKQFKSRVQHILTGLAADDLYGTKIERLHTLGIILYTKPWYVRSRYIVAANVPHME